MFGKKKAHVPQKQIDSLIGATTTIEGNINFAGGLRVDGCIKGHIHSVGDEPCTLVISEKARVEGEIRVSHVVIDGSVVGPVHASEYLELLPNARITGDVRYRTLEMQVGAVIDGRLLHIQAGAPEVIELKQLAGATVVHASEDSAQKHDAPSDKPGEKSPDKGADKPGERAADEKREGRHRTKP